MSNIFLIKKVEFESQSEDPFKFDSTASKIAEKYIPFSGVIQKPAYLVFVAYVNKLLKENKLHSQLKPRDNKTRLEKLLVYSWKHSEKPQGPGVIGSRIKNINPFEARDGNWVVQNCFKIYEQSARRLHLENLLDYYCSKNELEPQLLNDFLSRRGTLSANQKYLYNLLEKFSKKKQSLFNGDSRLSPALSLKFNKILKESLNTKEFTKDKIFIEKIFLRPSKSWNEIDKVLLSKKYPFREFNEWLSTFVIAVDNELTKGSSPLLWKKADAAYDTMKNHYIFPRRPKPQCWLHYENGRYILDKNNFDKAGWNAVLKRAKREDGHFYHFRLQALNSLLKEASGE